MMKIQGQTESVQSVTEHTGQYLGVTMTITLSAMNYLRAAPGPTTSPLISTTTT